MPEFVWIKNVLKINSQKERIERESIYICTLVKTRLETPLNKGIQVIFKKSDEREESL